MVYTAYQSTLLGSTLRAVSGNRVFRYPDEVDFPQQYTKEAIIGKGEKEGGHHTKPELSGRSSSFKQGKLLVRRRTSTLQRHSSQNHKNGTSFEATQYPTRHTDVGDHLGLAPSLGSPHRSYREAEQTGDRDLGRSESDDTVVDLGEALRLDEAGDRSDGDTNEEQSEQDSNTQKTEKRNPNLVTWYGDDDPENPYNWSTNYKIFVALQMAFLTFSIYIGSSIYSSGIAGANSITTEFGVSEVAALLGLTLFVLGYGIGPMIWSPITDFPSIGRLPVYLSTLAIFVGLQFPTIFAPNFGCLLAMRFLAGFFGSPALAVGGATMGDMFSPKHLTYAIGVWGCGAICGPVLGPLLGGFTFQAKNWQWPLWVLTWLSGGCFFFIAIFFPETSGKTILYRRTMRLRRTTGNPDLVTQEMINSDGVTPKKIIIDILWRPMTLFFEPALLVYNLYLALIYGLLYAWFESFPLVYGQGYGFNPGESGVAFLGIFVGAWLSCAAYCYYVYKYTGPIMDANGGTLPCPEIRLRTAPIAAICIPIAMFGFGLTGAYPEHIHWIVPIIFTGFFGIGAFILFQAIFAYFGDVYYADLGSVLTLNDLFRSCFGAAFPLFSGAMFAKLGIVGGNCLLGGLACCFIPFPFLFLKYGASIRNASKYAVKGKGWDEANGV